MPLGRLASPTLHVLSQKYVLSLIWLSSELWVMHLPSYLQELVSKQDTSHFCGNITDPLFFGVIFQVSGTLSNRPLDVGFSLLQGIRGPLIKLQSRLYLRFARNYYFCACLQSLFAADVWKLTPYYSLKQLVFIHLFLFCFSMNWAHFKWILGIFLIACQQTETHEGCEGFLLIFMFLWAPGPSTTLGGHMYGKSSVWSAVRRYIYAEVKNMLASHP